MSQKTVALDKFVHTDLETIKRELKKKNFTETVQFLIKEHKEKKIISKNKKRVKN